MVNFESVNCEVGLIWPFIMFLNSRSSSNLPFWLHFSNEVQLHWCSRTAPRWSHYHSSVKKRQCFQMNILFFLKLTTSKTCSYCSIMQCNKTTSKISGITQPNSTNWPQDKQLHMAQKMKISSHVSIPIKPHHFNDSKSLPRTKFYSLKTKEAIELQVFLPPQDYNEQSHHSLIASGILWQFLPS